MDSDLQSYLLIVVGAHLEAEAHDRPLAYRLRECILKWREASGCDGDGAIPVVCCDLWYLNAGDLMLSPAIAIGDPEHNAASAYLASRMPTSLVVEDSLRVHVDPEYVDLRACLWGIDPPATAAGVDLFIERYLDSFLRSVHALPPAGTG